MGNLSNYRDVDQIPVRVEDLSGALVDTPTATITNARVCADGEAFVLVGDVAGSGFAILDKTTLQPINYGYLTSNNGWFNEFQSKAICAQASTTMYAANLNPTALTIDSATQYGADKGSRIMLGSTGQGGSKSMTGAAAISASAAGSFRRWSLARNLISPPSFNTTYPAVADPGTLAGFADGGGTSGGLLSGTVYAKLCWITRTNLYRTRYGTTLPSDAISLALGANTAWNLDIPALPTNAIGYAIYLSTNGTDYYLAGASNATGTDAFTLKAAVTQLCESIATTRWSGSSGIDNMIFCHGGSTSLQAYDFGLAAPNDLASNITVTAASTGPMAWSPWQRDITVLHALIHSSTINEITNVDKIGLTSSTDSLNQTISETAWAGIPFCRNDNNDYPHIVDVPELGAWAKLAIGSQLSRVNLFSYLDGSHLWGYAVPMPTGLSYNATYGAPMRFADFQWIDGTCYCLINTAWNRSLLRVPVRIAG